MSAITDLDLKLMVGTASEKFERVICTQCEGAGRFESKFENGKFIRCDKCNGSGNVDLTAAEAERLGKIRAGEAPANPAQHLVGLLRRTQKILVHLAGENPSEETVTLVADIAKALAVDTLIKKGALEAVRSRLGKANGVIGLTGLPDPMPVEELEAAIRPLLWLLRAFLTGNYNADDTIKNMALELHKLWSTVKEAETEW